MTTGAVGTGGEQDGTASLPVARVVVDVPLPHLDHPFDFAVPADLAADAVPGVRVRVRFAGKQVGGYLLERLERSDHPGVLTPLSKVVSPEPVLGVEVLALARAVAQRYAGTLSDVLRLAVPPRHGRVEAEASTPRPAPQAGEHSAPWADYASGPAFVAALASGGSPRAVWTARPGADWAPTLAAAVASTAAAGRGALAVVPDARDLARLDVELVAALGEGVHVTLSADLGPAERYRRWLAVRRGCARVVIGTRAAAFAPVADLGLVAVWDDGDDLHADQRAPYPHVREVLCLRAHVTGAAALLGAYSRSAEAAALVDSGWAREVAPTRESLRAGAPRVIATGADADLARDPAARAARLPSSAWRVARDGLAAGPVLVQVPRRGYVPVLACVRCRTVPRCGACAAPLSLPGERAEPRCGWCGAAAARWRCPHCAATAFRAVVAGAGRTAEELGRAFPGTLVRWSTADAAVLATVSGEPALVVATPGAEPVAEGGYAAALLLDGSALLTRPDLRAGEEALRRWANAAALVRPGGPVQLVAEAAAPAVAALLRWDVAGFAARELAERRELGFPPAVRLAAVSGGAEAVADLLRLAQLPAGTDVLGPVPVPGGDEPRVRVVLRVPRERGTALATALRGALGVRIARKAAGSVRVQIDPVDLG